jgi:hypothetical protein
MRACRALLFKGLYIPLPVERMWGPVCGRFMIASQGLKRERGARIVKLRWVYRNKLSAI